MVVGSNSDPQQQQQQQQQQRQPSSFVLSQGAEVEVSSDEEGFRGAWYNATILECSSPQPPTKAGSSKKRKREVRVQYKTLLADDGITPLTEDVDPVFIRPLPPDKVDENVFGERVFQVNDAVDASYRDGWWTGTVIKVLQDNQYRVYFDNPPDVIDFDGRDLRFRFDWVNGCWVRPKKQPQETTGSMFSTGTAVEVILVSEGVQNGWVPALVIKENKDDTYLIKYQISSNTDEGGMVRNVMNSDCIRPAPPRCSKSSYELLEKVDTLCDFQWRYGIVTKVLEGGKYNVFLKPGNVDMEVDLSKIRRHVDWVDGKWVNLSKEIVVLSDTEECQVDAHSCTNNLEASMQTETSGAVEVNAKLNVGPQLTQSTEQLPSSTFHLKKRKIKLGAPSGEGLHSRPLSELTGDTAEDPLSGTALELKRMPIEMSTREPPQRLSSQKMAKQQKVVELDFQKVAVVTRERRPTKSPFRIQQAVAAVKKMNALNTAARNINGSVADSKEMEGPLTLGLEANGRRNSRSDYHSRLPEEERPKLLRNLNKDINGSGGNKKMVPNQQTSGGSTQRRKRGRPRKLVNLSSMSSKAGLVDHGTVDVPIKMAASADTTKELELRTQTTVHTADCITGEVDVVITGVSNNVDDDQPLSTWFGGMHNIPVDELRSSSGKSANGSTERGEPQGDTTVESSAIDANTNALPDHQCLPFVKKSPVWETIESMEVFKLIPQRPHFNPLADCKEEYREGTAIGIMVTFAGLFEKISSLQIDDCRSTLENTLETLLDLESHGFDVTVPRGRVNELMSIKDGLVELLSESNDVTRQLKEHAVERSKLSENIKDIEKKIAELQEELDASKSKLEAAELHIVRLQLHADAVKRQLESSGADFRKIATGSWKLP